MAAANTRDVRGKTVRMDDDLWAAIEGESDRTGASEAELMRRAATLYLAFLAAMRQPEGVSLAAVFDALSRKR